MMNTAAIAIAIGEGGVQPVWQLLTGRGRKGNEMTADDDDDDVEVEQPRRWASDATMIWLDEDELKRI